MGSNDKDRNIGMIDLLTKKNDLKRYGYTTLAEAISMDLLQVLRNYFDFYLNHQPAYFVNSNSILSRYGDFMLESVLLSLKNDIEPLSYPLDPSFSLLLAPQNVSTLIHQSTKAEPGICGVLNVGEPNEEKIELKTKADSINDSLSIEPGGLLVYDSERIKTWTFLSKGNRPLLAFFDYTDAQTIRGAKKFDGREAVGVLSTPQKMKERAEAFTTTK